MTASVYADSLQRGLVHVWAGRPIDAVLCFRRAIKAKADGPEARFHLGEMLWQLGMADGAIQSWRDAARIDLRFVPARLALAEALLSRGDFAGARAVAAEAVAMAPGDVRAQASRNAAAAALGDSAALEALVKLLAAQPELSLLPAYAPALARALEEAPRNAIRDDLVAELVPLAASLPSVLLAPVVTEAFPGGPTSLIEALRTRTWQRGEIDALRRIIVAVHPSEPAFAQELAATHAAMCMAEPLLLPSLWPVRTGGSSLRVAWLMPAPDSALFAAACAAVRETLQQLGRADVTMTIVCAGDPGATRAALPELPTLTAFLPLPPQPNATHARALAGSDPDVLVDLAGLSAATGLFLAASPARNVWSLAILMPGHAPALVGQIYASTASLAGRLRELTEQSFPDAPSASELAGWWDAAVRAHQQGDTAAASAGYARVLAAQPGYAPAHRLRALLARDGGDHETAEREFAP